MRLTSLEEVPPGGGKMEDCHPRTLCVDRNGIRCGVVSVTSAHSVDLEARRVIVGTVSELGEALLIRPGVQNDYRLSMQVSGAPV
jgi:hypothetical protein